MASLWKRPNSKFWTACFTAADGRQLKRSTGTTERRRAEKLAEQYERAARVKRTATQMRRVITDLHREITGEDAPTSTVEAFVKGWLERKKPEVGDSTYRYYEGQAKRFLEWLGDRATADLAEITRTDITAYRNALAGRLTGKTVNHSIQAVRSLFKEARRDGFVVDDPTEFVEAVRQKDETRRRPFTMKELQAVIAVANDEWRSIILFGLYTGQRLSDIAALTWAGIDLERDEIRLVTRKTGRRQILPIAAPLRQHIEGLPSSDDPNAPVHPEAFGHLSRTGRTARLSNQFADLLVQSGLRAAATNETEDEAKTEDVPAEKRGQRVRRAQNELSFHCIRHTATSLMKEAGIPASVVQDFIGHDDAAMSRLYTHTGEESLRKAAGALPSFQ
ncbi:MAG: tyrosine-type recombinase/integrase [Verrucomicrobiales bacterium]